jgi:small-conductance mechanosensitive channel
MDGFGLQIIYLLLMKSHIFFVVKSVKINLLRKMSITKEEKSWILDFWRKSGTVCMLFGIIMLLFFEFKELSMSCLVAGALMLHIFGVRSNG